MSRNKNCPICNKEFKDGVPMWNGSYIGMDTYCFDCRPEEADKPLSFIDIQTMKIKNKISLDKFRDTLGETTSSIDSYIEQNKLDISDYNGVKWAWIHKDGGLIDVEVECGHDDAAMEIAYKIDKNMFHPIAYFDENFIRISGSFMEEKPIFRSLIDKVTSKQKSTMRRLLAINKEYFFRNQEYIELLTNKEQHIFELKNDKIYLTTEII